MKYNYEKMGQYSDKYETYVKDFQENCKNSYLKNTKIITISQEQMRRDTGGGGLAYTDGVNIYIPELTREQNVITSDLKDKNLNAKIIRRAFVLHEIAHFEEDNPSSFLRSIYEQVNNKALQDFKTKDLLENKNGEIEKFNTTIVEEVSKRFELQYGKTLSKENYKKYVGIYLNNNLRKKNTVFRFYNRWVDRYIENQLPLLAKDQEDYRNVKSILHFLRINMAKKDLEYLSPSKADIRAGRKIDLINKLTLLTSNYIDPRTRPMFEEAKRFDKDKDWKKYYQLNRDEIEKMYSVNKKLSIIHYGQYNTYVRNDKDIYSVYFNDSARRIFDKLNDDFKEEMEEEKKQRQEQQKQQQEKNKDKQQNQEPQQGDGEPSEQQESQQGDAEGESQENGSKSQKNDKNGEKSKSKSSSSEEEGEEQEQQSGEKGSGQGKSSPSSEEEGEEQEQQSGGKGSGQGKPSPSSGGDEEENGQSSGGGSDEEEFSEEEMKDFKNSFKEELNKKTDKEIMEEIINGFTEDELRDLLKEAAKKEEEALEKQNQQSFGKDKIQDQKGKQESEKPEEGKEQNAERDNKNDNSEKKDNKSNKKFENSDFSEFVNYKSSTANDRTEEININKLKVNEMIINFEKLIRENREVRDLMNKAKELLKSSTTKQKKRMTSGSHKKIVDRAIRGDVKIFNKFVSFDLGDLDIFILIDNSGSMGDTMRNAKIPFLQTRKDYSLFFCYLIKKIFEPLGANIDIKSFTTGYGNKSSTSQVHRNSGIVWENLQNIDDDDNTKRKNYDNIIQSKLNGAQSGTNLFAAFNEYVPKIRKHQYKQKRPILLFTVSDGDTSFDTVEEKNHSIYLNNLIEKDVSIKHIKLCINSMSLIKYFGATVDKTRFVQSDSNVLAIKNGIKSVVGKTLSAKNNSITIDGKTVGKANDFSYIENFEDISKFMLENLDSIFNIILNNGKQVISNHKGKTISTNKNLGPMM